MVERDKIKNILVNQKGQDIRVDVHTHCGFDHFNIIRRRYPTSQSVKDLVFKLEATGIDYAVSFQCANSTYYFDFRELPRKSHKLIPLPAESFPYEFANRQLFYEVSLFGDDRILPFATILPKYDEGKQVESLSEYAKKNCLFGLKLHTLATLTYVKDLLGSAFMELATNYSLPVMIHSGPDEYSRPEKIIELAQSYPKVRFCIAHAARFEQSAFDMFSGNRNPNVFFDTSPFLSLCSLTPLDIQRGVGGIKLDLPYGNPRDALIKLYSFASENLVWGTDEPWTTITDDTQQGILAKFGYRDEVDLLNSLPKEIKIAIANDNIQKFLFGDE